MNLPVTRCPQRSPLPAPPAATPLPLHGRHSPWIRSAVRQPTRHESTAPVSPFLALPQDAWVASNALAFAILDRYPVSPGHTLIITRRLIPTWFEATREEQLAMLELVDRIKAQLDLQSPKPDGYNVGFNAGAAAGQTVGHVHVHVIPRYQGDMEDPRGGVRHVIPAKGNYLLDAQRPPVRALATGGDSDPFLGHLAPLFARAERIAIVAAFVQDSGLDVLKTHVESALERGAELRLITGDYLAITQVQALQRLLDWSNEAHALQHDSETPRGTFATHVIETERPGRPARSFHPKSWRLEGPGFAVAFVGSSNLSRSALGSGVEWNLRLERRDDPRAYSELEQAFEDLWAQGRPLTQAWVDDYADPRARESASRSRKERPRSSHPPRSRSPMASSWRPSPSSPRPGPRDVAGPWSSSPPASGRRGSRPSTWPRGPGSTTAAGPGS